MDIRFGGTLEKGDMIAIANNNSFEVGWYVGRGKTGTLQYYTLNYLHYWYAAYSNLTEERNEHFKKPAVSYINSPNFWRIIKVNREIITEEEDKINYEKAIKTLEILKIIN